MLSKRQGVQSPSVQASRHPESKPPSIQSQRDQGPSVQVSRVQASRVWASRHTKSKSPKSKLRYHASRVLLFQYTLKCYYWGKLTSSKRHTGKAGLWMHDLEAWTLDAWMLGLWTTGLWMVERLDSGCLDAGSLVAWITDQLLIATHWQLRRYIIGNSNLLLLDSIWKNVYLQLLSYCRKMVFQWTDDCNCCGEINSKPLKDWRLQLFFEKTNTLNDKMDPTFPRIKHSNLQRVK